MSSAKQTEPISWRIAKHLFREKEASKNNTFDTEDWLGYYGIRLTEGQQEKARSFPWSEEILTSLDPFHWDKNGEKKEIRETHFAFFGLDRVDISAQVNDPREFFQPLTLKQWEKLNPIYEGPTKDNLPKFYLGEKDTLQYHDTYNGENVVRSAEDYNSWFREENLDFNKHAPSLRWYLMPMVPRFFEIGATDRTPRATRWFECLTALTGKSEPSIAGIYIKNMGDFPYSYPADWRGELTTLSPRTIKEVDENVLAELLEENIYDIPFTVEEVMKVMLYHKKNNLILNQHASGGCRELSYGDDVTLTTNSYEKPNALDRISVGQGMGAFGGRPYPSMGLDMRRNWIVGRDGFQGLSLSRKPGR